MSTSSLVDEAYIQFDRVKKLTAELAEVENSVYRLATAVGKTQKRANALKNIIIPPLYSDGEVHHRFPGGKGAGGLLPSEGD